MMLSFKPSIYSLFVCFFCVARDERYISHVVWCYLPKIYDLLRVISLKLMAMESEKSLHVRTTVSFDRIYIYT